MFTYKLWNKMCLPLKPHQSYRTVLQYTLIVPIDSSSYWWAYTCVKCSLLLLEIIGYFDLRSWRQEGWIRLWDSKRLHYFLLKLLGWRH